MRLSPIPAISALLLAAALAPAVQAFDWVCNVNTPSVVSDDGFSATIHSAGYLAFTTDGETPWYATTVYSDHSLRRQSNGMLQDSEYAYSVGEVHTYTRASVLKGYAYYSKIDGERERVSMLDLYSVATTCSSPWLALESPNPPDGGGDGEETPPEETCCWGTPILIDLGGGGFRLTDLADGVAFDIDADGAIDQVAWTVPDAEDGWLALDRNHNGLVDDGTELFGNFTPQPESDEPHGYRALVVFDSPNEGGNGDGWITAADLVFDSLLLWNDGNQDGISQGGELRSLHEAGIAELDLAVVESRRRDRHGNEFRYSATVRLVRGSTKSADVFLLSNLGN